MTSNDRIYVDTYLSRSVTAMASLAADAGLRDLLAEMADATCQAMRNGRKLMLAGNGGSAGDSQHIAGEFISRLMFDHPPLPAIALTVDSSAMTATSNDYGYEYVFERQVLGLGQPGDVFLAISTSGRSPNVLRALAAAKTKGIRCLGFAGRDGGAKAEYCDLTFRAPADETAIIQQLHITAAHVFCALVERTMFPDLVPG